jgi:hypothetical protein
VRSHYLATREQGGLSAPVDMQGAWAQGHAALRFDSLSCALTRLPAIRYVCLSDAGRVHRGVVNCAHDGDWKHPPLPAWPAAGCVLWAKNGPDVRGNLALRLCDLCVLLATPTHAFCERTCRMAECYLTHQHARNGRLISMSPPVVPCCKALVVTCPEMNQVLSASPPGLLVWPIHR